MNIIDTKQPWKKETAHKQISEEKVTWGSYIPNLEAAIDTRPIVVTPDTLVVEAIALMSQTLGKSCELNVHPQDGSVTHSGARASCVLVMDAEELLGILTERDIVRLTAKGIDFTTVKIAEVMAHPIISIEQANFQDIFAALFLFRRYRIRHLPILDEQGKLVGIISPESLRQVLKPANLLKLRRVAEVMTTEIIHAPIHTPVLHLAQLMAKHRVSCIVIVQESEEDSWQPVGIVTERDIVQFQSLQLPLMQIKAQEVMSTPLFLLHPEDSLWIAHQEMQNRRVRRLVVSWNWGRGLGIITQTSLLRVFDPMEMYGVIDTLQRTVEQLESQKVTFFSQCDHKQDLSPEKLPALEDDNNQGNSTTQELDILLSRMQTVLENLLQGTDLSLAPQPEKLDSMLDSIKQTCHLVQQNLPSRME